MCLGKVFHEGLLNRDKNRQIVSTSHGVKRHWHPAKNRDAAFLIFPEHKCETPDNKWHRYIVYNMLHQLNNCHAGSRTEGLCYPENSSFSHFTYV